MVFQILAVLIFALSYIGIATEHRFHINKSAWALFAGGILWLFASLYDPKAVDYALSHAGYEIFSITMFLLAAMSLVEILISCGLFDLVRTKILKYKLSNKHQFLILSILAFILSGIVDNLTATIILIQIARKFFKGQNLLVVAVGIVLAANAGGAMSPIGDVTTIMIWLAGKFSAAEILIKGFLPSLAIGTVAYLMLVRKVTEEKNDDEIQENPVNSLSRNKKIIVVVALLSFTLPLVAKLFHLPPVVGILFGLGLTWLVVDFLNHRKKNDKSAMTENIEHLLQKTDIASISFFVGILLAVSALGVLGLLDYVSTFLFGAEQETIRVIVGTVLLGMISSVLDNIPLTAIAINILEVTNTNLWVLLAIAVGTGGSLLSIGSAAGVVAMGLVKELTFKKYFLIGFVPALISFSAGIIVWLIQTLVFGGL